MQTDVRYGQGRQALPGRRWVAALAGALVSVLAVPDVYAQQWQIGSAPTFSSGRYGTDTVTDVLHTPITAQRLFDNGDVAVVFPFLCVWGDASVTVVNGTPVRTDGAGRLAGTDGRAGLASGTFVRGGTDAASAPMPVSPFPSQACGTGDIVVRGRYYVVDEHGWAPTIALRGHVKAPTASAERGLGTGRPDEGVGVEVSRAFAGTFVMADVGYTVIGDPTGFDYDDNWWYDVGVGQDLARGVVNLSVFFEEYSSIVPGLPTARDILAAVMIRGAGGWRLQVSGQFGLSDGAPDHGLSVGLSRRF